MAYPKHEAVVRWAKGEIGTMEVPYGSNRGPRVTYYQSFDFLAGGGYPWCVDLWLAAWAVGGKRPIPYKSPGAYDLYRWAQRAGWTTNAPIPGDGVCFNLGAGHWGMFLRFEDGGRTVVVIEGNASHRVKEGKYRRSSVRGFMHVPEQSVTLPKKAKKAADKPPLFVLTTSINGHRKYLTTQRGYEALSKVVPKLAKKYKDGITITRSKPKRGT